MAFLQDSRVVDINDNASMFGGFDEDIILEDHNSNVQEGGRNIVKTIPASRRIIKELSLDPMFIVLRRFLVSKKGNSLVNILEDIKDHLAALRLLHEKK